MWLAALAGHFIIKIRIQHTFPNGLFIPNRNSKDKSKADAIFYIQRPGQLDPAAKTWIFIVGL